MSKSTQPRKPIVLGSQTKEQGAKEKMAQFIAERRRAYAESTFVAFCQNPNIVNGETSAKEVAEKAVSYADALLDALIFNPMKQAAKENKTK